MSFERPTVREHWQAYADRVIPSDAPEDQIREMRRAFYASAHSILCDIMIGLDADQKLSQERMNHILALHNELLIFNNSVLEGKA